ncbi:hypothetical protein H4Q26_001421 [Puccinia striiformis f. sp. tritici PST-130]|nr:hypothetical protein H4Q26_001421 [Puccinia striiformis f. sp. tritici PST-130]
MVRARIVSTSEGKKRKQPEADDSVDEDMGQIERVKDDGDEQALTTGIDEKVSMMCSSPSIWLSHPHPLLFLPVPQSSCLVCAHTPHQEMDPVEFGQTLS